MRYFKLDFRFCISMRCLTYGANLMELGFVVFEILKKVWPNSKRSSAVWNWQFSWTIKMSLFQQKHLRCIIIWHKGQKFSVPHEKATNFFCTPWKSDKIILYPPYIYSARVPGINNGQSLRTSIRKCHFLSHFMPILRQILL